MKKYVSMYLFPFLLEVCNLNKRALFVEYPDSGYNSFDVLFEGSKSLPRKKKKQVRKYLIKPN
jgi:hypothetical protein